MVPLLLCEASGRGANPFDGVLNFHVPQSDGAVGIVADQGVPVGAERQRVDGTAARLGLAELAEQARVHRIGDVPQLDRAVGVVAGQGVAVGVAPLRRRMG